MHYVYVLQDRRTQEFYYGYTSNLKRRLAQHAKERPWELAYYEAYKAEQDARRRERQLKHHAQAVTALKMRIKESRQ